MFSGKGCVTKSLALLPGERYVEGDAKGVADRGQSLVKPFTGAHDFRGHLFHLFHLFHHGRLDQEGQERIKGWRVLFL